MQSATLIRLRPTGPWRIGPGDGSSDRVDTLYRSDRLYSALTIAMRDLGWLDEWISATAQTEKPVLAFSSLFPYQAETLFAIPPNTLWPPAPSVLTIPSLLFLSKIRWSAARFVPTGVIESLLLGQTILADQWLPDAESGCLLRRDRPSSSPFRTVVRHAAAIDRLGSSVHPHSLACVEFESNSGLWGVVRYANITARTTWNERVQAAFRLLADTGFGGRKSSGWGQTEMPIFHHGAWPNVFLSKLAASARAGNSGRDANSPLPPLYWLLSLFSPAPFDTIDWNSGDYCVTVRGGRIHDGVFSGALKKSLRMIEEGSVLAASAEPVGAIVDLAPEGFPHPIYRSGSALVLELPTIVDQHLELTPAEAALPEADETTSAAELMPDVLLEEITAEPPEVTSQVAFEAEPDAESLPIERADEASPDAAPTTPDAPEPTDEF